MTSLADSLGEDCSSPSSTCALDLHRYGYKLLNTNVPLWQGIGWSARTDLQRLLILGQVPPPPTLPPPPLCGFGQLVQSVGDNPPHNPPLMAGGTAPPHLRRRCWCRSSQSAKSELISTTIHACTVSSLPLSSSLFQLFCSLILMIPKDIKHFERMTQSIAEYGRRFIRSYDDLFL